MSGDRFFAVGCLKLADPALVLREIQRVRDTWHRYGEIKFTRTRSDTHVRLYADVVDCLATDPDAEFFCFVADRTAADPIERFGSQWSAYAKLAEQLLHGVLAPDEILTVLADEYSTPNEIELETVIRRSLNRRIGRLAVASITRLNSKSTDGLQLVDLLTSGVTFEFRADAGMASPDGYKAQLAAHVRSALGTPTCLDGWRSARHSIQIYSPGS